MDIHFITSSAGKFTEAQRIIPELKQLVIDLPEIQASTGQPVISHKLQIAKEHHQGEFIAEDTGLYLDCLHGLPGPLIKWFMKEMGNEAIADMALHLGDTRAQATTWIGYSFKTDEQTEETRFFDGSISGTIVAPRGDWGFGWDAIFQPDGYDKTFAEMTPEEKDSVSMRRIAFEKLRDFLHTSRE